ncbi:MAG: hypothetical protein HY909_15495 [Deltaproteobacteria bacterium]|jgi:hypothetical protein|nr:hypothetical protein [Deltaproteobacteria bacterium]
MAIVKQLSGRAFFNIPDEQLEKFMIPADQEAAVLKENGIILGVAGTPPEGARVKKLEPVTATTVAAADASASYLRWVTVACPHCHSANRILEDTDRYLWFTCGYCGGSFQY